MGEFNLNGTYTYSMHPFTTGNPQCFVFIFMARKTQKSQEGTTMEKPSRTGSQWRLNVGRALDVLRRDVAGLFSRRNYTPDFSIYSPEIEVRKSRLGYIGDTLLWLLNIAMV